MGTVPMGTGLFLTIHSRVSWMCLPVERSMIVSAPQRVAQTIFSTSSSIELPTARVVSGRNHLSLCGEAVRNPEFTNDLDDFQVRNVRISAR